jgi:hypothetical protein
MKKFLILYVSPKSAAERMTKPTPEQVKGMMDAWFAWKNKIGSALVDFGNPTGHAATAPAGGSMLGDAKIGGYSILQAESTAAAEGLIQDHPFLAMPGSSIEVLEYLPIPGM